MNLIKQFYKYYLPYKKLFWIDFLAAVVSAILELSFPMLVNFTIDKIMPSQDFKMIAFVCIFLLLFYVINMFLRFVVVYLGHKLGLSIETDMRDKLYNHIQAQNFTFFDNAKTGKLITNLTNDLFEISEVAHHGPEELFIAIMTLFVSFLLMFNINATLAISTILLVPIIGFAINFYRKLMVKINNEIYDSLGEFNAGLESKLSGMKVIQSFAREDFESKHFAYLNHLYLQAKLKFYKTMGNSSALNYFTMRLMNLWALIFGSYLVLDNQITNGQFVGFLLLTNVFLRPIEAINMMLEMFPKGIAGFQRFQNTLNQKPQITDLPNARTCENLNGKIEYKNVDFAYNNNQILINFNLEIEEGKTYAFVGESGSGKTTITNLLPRFYEINKGEILINGENIQNFTLKSLRSNIGIVSQDIFLFPGTIYDNILYGNLQATNQQIDEVVKMAHLEKTIENMPNGLQTIIGERGVKLSGGQKQRLAIARMFLKNPNILILDEATSALDTQTENIIQENIEELTKNRTTLIVAHRLSTIKKADVVVVIDKGQIVESGSYQDLLNQNGAFKKLYDAQFGKM